MPIYACKCQKCDHREDVYRTIAEYHNLPYHCGEKMQRIITPPHVIEDMKPYRSPIDGSIVSSRRAHRDHMVKHDVIEVGNEKLTRPARKNLEPTGIKEDLSRAYDKLANA